MTNKKASITEFMVLLIMVVLTSAAVLFLVKSGIVSVRADGNEEVSILDVEFIPVGREGYLAIKEFQFCEMVDERYACVNEKDTFNIGEEVHFRFVVESSTAKGEVMLVENYRIKGPAGEILLEVNEENNYPFAMTSSKQNELIYFRDYFIINLPSAPGRYTLDLVVENPLLNKKTTLTKALMIGEGS